jgi:hypothetical protein
MKDLYPLLIILALSVLGSIISRKKRATENSGSIFSPDNEEQDDMPEWFKRFIPEEEVFEKVQPATTLAEQLAETRTKVEDKKPEPVANSKYQQFSGFISPDERQKMMSLEGGRAITGKSKWKTDNEQVEPSPIEVIAKNKKTPFDLRQAVIHSAILNRKYS